MNDYLHLCSSDILRVEECCVHYTNIIWVIKVWGIGWAGCTGFTGETWRKQPPGRHMYRWEDNIKTDLNVVVHRPGFMWLRIGRSEGLLRTLSS